MSPMTRSAARYCGTLFDSRRIGVNGSMADAPRAVRRRRALAATLSSSLARSFIQGSKSVLVIYVFKESLWTGQFTRRGHWKPLIFADLALRPEPLTVKIPVDRFWAMHQSIRIR